MEDLKEYQSIKTVKAAPMSYKEAGEKGLVRNYNPEAEDVDGYYVLYEDGYESWSPKDTFEKGYVEIKKYSKTYGNTCANGTKKNVKDVKFWGKGDLFELISKASSENEGWMKSTKAMEIEGVGVVVQVTTQQGDNVAEAVTFVPGAKIKREYTEKDGVKTIVSRTIVKIS
jgi:hypothetical protein